MITRWTCGGVCTYIYISEGEWGMAVRLLIDSASDFDLKEATERNMLFVPLSINFGDDSYQDGVTIEKNEFYEKLLNGKIYPQTAQPAPDLFLEHFKAAKEAGDELVAIVISSGLSGTLQSALIAKDMCDYDGIYVVDSLNCVTGLRLLIDVAAKMRDDGASAKEIVAEIEELRHRVKIVAVVDTLEFLYKGGRLTKTAQLIGTLASLKPFVSLDENGKIYVLDKVIGRKKAYKNFFKILEKTPFDPAYPINFLYFYEPENGHILAKDVAELYPGVDAKCVYPCGPTIGAHVGNNAYGFSYIVKK